VTFVHPRRDAAALLDEVYDAGYWRSERPRERGYADYLADDGLHRRTFERRLRALAPQLPAPGRALDVGCAAGHWVELLVEAGWDAHGLEPSGAAALHARQRLGPRLLEGTLEDPRLDGPRFDLVTLWDVIEHLPAPLEALARVRELLSPGGRLVLETQDLGSPLARLLGRRWHHFKHDEHLVHFDARTLRATLERAGLRVLSLQRRGAGKFVRGDFLVERSARLHRALPRLLRPWLGGDWSVYVNPLDEWIAVAERGP
jgi:SAM-dependent methyltransferase